MVNAAIARTAETIDRRAEDLRSIYASGIEPNFDDVRRSEQVEPVHDPLSVALPEGAYLIGGEPSRPSYFRDGALRMREGVLVAPDGVTPVLGFSENRMPEEVPHPLRVEERDALLGRALDVRVESDGVVAYARTIVDPQTLQSHAERVVAGRIALARFPSGTRLERIDATHARAPSAVAPFVGTPSDGSFAGLATWSRARGGLDSDRAISRLADGYLAMRALGAAERARNDMLRGTFEIVK